MRLPLWHVGFTALLLSLAATATSAPQDPPADDKLPSKAWSAAGKKGAVAAGGQGAVDAGMEILKAGGNAADAAAATILALSVTDGTAFCFGGEVPILVYDAKRGGVEVLCGLGADVLRIQLGYPGPDFFKGTDPRGDPRIHDALKAGGKLKTPG